MECQVLLPVYVLLRTHRADEPGLGDSCAATAGRAGQHVVRMQSLPPIRAVAADRRTMAQGQARTRSAVAPATTDGDVLIDSPLRARNLAGDLRVSSARLEE